MKLYLIVDKNNEYLLKCGHPFSDPSNAFAYIKQMSITNVVVAERVLDLMVPSIKIEEE